MTMHEDDTIISALRTLTDHDAADAAPVSHLLRRGRSVRTRRTGVLGTAGLGLVGLATAFAVTVGTGNAGPPTGQQVSLAMAADATAETSFHIKIAVPLPGKVEGDSTARLPDLVIEGAYDPVRENGYLKQTSTSGWAGAFPQIEVGGTCYIEQPVGVAQGGGLRWYQATEGCFSGQNLGTTASWIGDPTDLLKQLAANGSAKLVSRTGSGKGEVDVWSYSYTRTVGAQGAMTEISTGTATVDVGTQHVTKLTVSTAVAGQNFKAKVNEVTYEFSDFGTPVTVTAPSPVSTTAPGEIPSSAPSAGPSSAPGASAR